MELGQFTLSSMTPIPVVNPNHLSITLKYEKLLNPIAKKNVWSSWKFSIDQDVNRKATVVHMWIEL